MTHGLHGLHGLHSLSDLQCIVVIARTEAEEMSSRPRMTAGVSQACRLRCPSGGGAGGRSRETKQ